ncbi:MAG: PEP-CTERM sorting domain-containing protein [Planctomycetes bacterium]|nr:PEP-CTERM sorting domain-containing protein [Planctomycetota bacterium]
MGGLNSAAMDVNNSGDVVGWSQTSNGNTDLFVYDNGVMTDLSTLTGYTFGSVYGINDAGQIIADYIGASNNRTAYLLTPVTTPEPAALSVMMLALGAILLTKRRLCRD